MTKNHASLAIDPYYDGVPAYMTEVYDWAYVDPKWVRVLDHNWVVRVQLFLNDQRLIRSYLNEIKEGMRVWQLAHVYGDLVTRAAHRVGPNGVFHMTDVTPIQLEHAQRKLAGLDWTKVIRSDAASFNSEERVDYDLICSFFLLHEVHDEKKYEIVDHMLEKLPKGSMDKPTSIRAFLLGQAYSLAQETNKTMKRTNNKPCMDPTCLTASGCPYMYLRGMAIKSKIRKEIPSKIPMMRKYPNVDMKNDSIKC